jgi:hypothetical protein
MQRVSFRFYIKVRDVVEKDPSLRQKLSQVLVGILRPDRTTVDVSSDIVNLTESLADSGFTADTISKSTILQSAHVFLTKPSAQIQKAMSLKDELSIRITTAESTLKRKNAQLESINVTKAKLINEIAELTSQIDEYTRAINGLKPASADDKSALVTKQRRHWKTASTAAFDDFVLATISVKPRISTKEVLTAWTEKTGDKITRTACYCRLLHSPHVRLLGKSVWCHR